MKFNELRKDTLDALDPFNHVTITVVEKKLQLKLPADYVGLMKIGLLEKILLK